MDIVYSREGKEMPITLDETQMVGLQGFLDQVGLKPGQVLLIERIPEGVMLHVEQKYNRQPEVAEQKKTQALKKAFELYDDVLQGLAE